MRNRLRLTETVRGPFNVVLYFYPETETLLSEAAVNAGQVLFPFPLDKHCFRKVLDRK